MNCLKQDLQDFKNLYDKSLNGDCCDWLSALDDVDFGILWAKLLYVSFVLQKIILQD